MSQGTNQQVSYLPSKDHKEMTIAVVAAGRTSSNPEAINPTDPLVILPAFDAGAAQALLSYAVSHPTPQNHLSVYLTRAIRSVAASPIPTPHQLRPKIRCRPTSIASPPSGSREPR